MDYPKGEQLAVKDVKKAFGIKGEWRIPPGNSMKRLNVASIMMPEGYDRERITSTIKLLCGGYQAE